MTLIQYTAGDTRSHKKVGDELRALKPGNYIIEVKKNRPIRSISQNKFYWALLNLVAADLGYTSREVEYMFKMDRCYQHKDLPNGKSTTIPKDTSTMDVAEFTVVINNLIAWIRENCPQIIVPRKEDINYEQWMKIERDYERTQQG